jgi:hypothetical protein
MITLNVDQGKCILCGECSVLFPGMPDAAFSGILIPAWAETCFRASKPILLEKCKCQAISIEEPK